MSNLKVNEHELLAFDLEAKPIMDNYLSMLNLDTSDYTFAANYLWLSGGSGFYSIIENAFCFFLLSNGELTMILPPIGKRENVINAMRTCFSIMDQNNSIGLYTKIEYVDESLLSAFATDVEEGAEMFDIFEEYLVERTLVDYVYDCVDLIELKGNDYASKRNEINKFRRIHPDHEMAMLDPIEHGPGIMQLVNSWISERMKYQPTEQTDKFLDGIYSERAAVKRMLRDYEKLDLIGLVILINGVIAGFTVGEKINERTASVIIEKTDFNILGCAQYIFREFAKLLAAQYQVASINVGDDMGFENLKKVKMSYRPNSLIPKYTIYKRQP
ncbi:MAG: phosphatidylglycerol lysyltransferase domain-containing protein [Pseudomonadales bacterium]